MKKLQLSNREIGDFCEQLALMLHTGILMSDSLRLLAEEETEERKRQFLQDTAELAESGMPLSEALSRTANLPQHLPGLLRVGEESGRTEEALTALSQYYEQQDRMNRQLWTAVTYPAVLLMMMLAVIVVLLSYVLPVFQEVYVSLGGRLTGLGGGLMALGQGLNRMMPVLAALLGAAVLTVGVFSVSPAVRARALRLWQRYRGDRGLSRKVSDARLAQVLSMAISSGMPVERGIALAGSMLKNSPAAVRRCEECIALLDAGEDLSDALEKTEMLPLPACRMLKLGLRAGVADKTMEQIARRLSEESRQTIRTRVGRIEPALVLVTSILVGGILLSVMLPLIHIMKAIG